MNGFRNLLWFLGIVEDNNDPMALGRVRVRCFEIHSTDREKLPTEDLPWASPINGSYTNAYKPPQINAWVFGFFIDGDEAQHPMLIGTVPGMMTELPDGSGYGSYGLDNPCDLYQPDLSRRARGESVHETSVPAVNADAGQEIQTADPKTKWTNPGSSYDTQYPHNYVHETSSGHVFELDDTPGAERVNFEHRNGSRIELDPVGNVKIEARGDIYMLATGNRMTNIKGADHITVEGASTIYAKNDMNLTVDGDLNTNVHGDYSLNVAGSYKLNVGQGADIRAMRVGIETTSNGIDINAAKDLKLSATSQTHLSSGSEMAIGSGGQTSIKAGGIVGIDGSEVYLNSGTAQSSISAGVTKINTDPIKLKSPVKIAKPSKLHFGINSVDESEIL